MKDRLLKIKEKIVTDLQKIKTEIKAVSLTLVSAYYAMPMKVYANNAGATGGAGGTTPKSVIISIMDTLIDVFPAIGVVLVAIGAYKLFMAFRNDQPDAYSGAAKDIVIGVVLLIFKVFIWDKLKTTINGL